MKIFLVIASLLIACHSVRAVDPKASPPAGKAGPTVQTKPSAETADASGAKVYAPKNKSVFKGAITDHNPFWPIGWVKMETAPGGGNTAESVMVPHASDFSVSSILLNEPPLAIVNGKEMAEGETAVVIVNGQPIVIQLMAVQDGRVVIRWQNQNIPVALHRNEVLSKPEPSPAATVLR